MKTISRIVFVSFMCKSVLSCFGQEKETVRLVLTTAIVQENAEARKKQYEESIRRHHMLGNNPYIVEGVQPAGPSYFEEWVPNEQIFYFKGNKPGDKNRGKFEGLSLQEGLKNFKFGPKELIYKQTGRYLAKRNLSEIVKQYPGHDCWIRWNDQEDWVLLVAYIIKNEKLQEILGSLDYEKMEQEYDPSNPRPAMIEAHFTNALKQREQEKGLDICYINEPLGIIVDPWTSSTGLVSDKTLY